MNEIDVETDFNVGECVCGADESIRLNCKQITLIRVARKTILTTL